MCPAGAPLPLPVPAAAFSKADVQQFVLQVALLQRQIRLLALFPARLPRNHVIWTLTAMLAASLEGLPERYLPVFFIFHLYLQSPEWGASCGSSD